MNDDLLALLLGLPLLLMIYFTTDYFFKKKTGNRTFHADFIAPLSLIALLFFFAFIAMFAFNNPWLLMLPVALSFVIIPASLVLTAVKLILFKRKPST